MNRYITFGGRENNKWPTMVMYTPNLHDTSTNIRTDTGGNNVDLTQKFFLVRKGHDYEIVKAVPSSVSQTAVTTKSLSSDNTTPSGSSSSSQSDNVTQTISHLLIILTPHYKQ